MEKWKGFLWKGFHNLLVFKQVPLKRRERDACSSISSSTISGTSGCVKGETEWQKSTISCLHIVLETKHWDRWTVSLSQLRISCFIQSYLMVWTRDWAQQWQEACIDMCIAFAEYLWQKLEMVPSCNVSDSLKVVETPQILHFEILDGC